MHHGRAWGKRDQFRRVNLCELPVLPWLRAYRSSFRISLRAHPWDEMSIAASEGGLEPSEADDSAEHAPMGAEP